VLERLELAQVQIAHCVGSYQIGETPPVALPTVQPALPPWWRDEAGIDPTAPALLGDVKADVCVIGGGFTGLWTALALRAREPSARVVLLEADRCGAGPSGRNGGFIHGYWAGVAGVRRTLGDDGAVRLARAAEAIIPGVRSLGADVWLREGGMLKVSTTPSQDAAIDRAVRAADELGAPEEAVALDERELAARVASPVFRRGVFFRECATVQPARLVRALRAAILAAGIELYEGTQAVDIADGLVTTRSGRVRADAIVVATNAAASGWRPVRRHVTNFGSYVVLTEPAPELLREIGWTGGEAIVDARMFLHYFRTTDDGRVLMGSGSGPNMGSGACCPGSLPRVSSARGAGRSTCPPTICRSSAPSPARKSTTGSATPVTASGRAGSAARSSHRSRFVSTTSGRSCRSRRGACPTSRPSR
jgi:glycine/D-amino acid oxidase-like deaminating enzyme